MTTQADPVTGELALTAQDYATLDRMDEEQILAELRGQVLDTYVYSFPQGGKTVTGLSWAGIKAIASKMGAVGIDLAQLLETDTGWTCVVRATGPDGSSRIGAAQQAKQMWVNKDNKFVDDPHALPKAINKAQRNAIRALLPETLITALIEEHRNRGRVTPSQNQPQRPAITVTKPDAATAAPTQAKPTNGTTPTNAAAAVDAANARLVGLGRPAYYAGESKMYHATGAYKKMTGRASFPGGANADWQEVTDNLVEYAVTQLDSAASEKQPA